MAEIKVDESAIKRIQELRTERGEENLKLRITVEGGGCSGFQYNLVLSSEIAEDDHIFAECVVSDDISLPFITGSTVKFEQSLVGAEFKIENPNATMGCGCGTSFAV